MSEAAHKDGGAIPDFRAEPWSENFNFDYYFSLVDILRQGRKLLTFTEAASAIEQPGASIGLLRHDIDENPHKAVELAYMEAERGIVATYFVIPNAKTYSLDDAHTVKALKRIVHEYGHEIGLHYNPNQWIRDNIKDPEDLEKDIAAQAQEVEQALDIPIRSVTFHEPGADHPSWLGGSLHLGGLVNGYAGVFFSPAKSALYATDSAGKWSFGEPIPRVTQAITANARVIQLLVHAEWWSK